MAGAVNSLESWGEACVCVCEKEVRGAVVGGWKSENQAKKKKKKERLPVVFSAMTSFWHM